MTYVNVATSEAHTTPLQAFLNGAAPKESDPSELLREIMGSAVPQLSFIGRYCLSYVYVVYRDS